MNEKRVVKAEGSLPYCTSKRDLCYLLDVPHRSSLRSLPMSGNQPLFNEVHVCFNPFLQNVPGFLRRERPPFWFPSTPLLLTTAGTPLCHLPVQFNTDNTDIWNNTIHPSFLEIIDFSVSCWLYLRYEKARIFFPEDFKSLTSFQTKIDFSSLDSGSNSVSKMSLKMP